MTLTVLLVVAEGCVLFCCMIPCEFQSKGNCNETDQEAEQTHETGVGA